MYRTKTSARIWSEKSNIDSKHRAYSPTYDAYYDRRDGKWLERRCGDPRCDFCKNRPLFAQVMD